MKHTVLKVTTDCVILIHINIKNKDVSTFLFCSFAIFMVINKTYLSFEQKTNKKKNLLDDTFDSVWISVAYYMIGKTAKGNTSFTVNDNKSKWLTKYSRRELVVTLSTIAWIANHWNIFQRPILVHPLPGISPSFTAFTEHHHFKLLQW